MKLTQFLKLNSSIGNLVVRVTDFGLDPWDVVKLRDVEQWDCQDAPRVGLPQVCFNAQTTLRMPPLSPLLNGVNVQEYDTLQNLWVDQGLGELTIFETHEELCAC